jgi:hypothetical protein
MSSGVDRVEHLRQHLIAIGCTCDEVELRPWVDQDGLDHISISHDSGCPILRKMNAANQ